MSGSLSRRRLLELAGLGGVAAVAAGSGAVLFERRENGDDGGGSPRRSRSTARTQAGIVTPQQNHLRFASFDLTATIGDRGARPPPHLDGRRSPLRRR